MKTFRDLEFEEPDFLRFVRARLNFPNGYGISVIKGPYAHSGIGTYEVAVLYENDLCYTTPITDDVLGYQTPEQITNIMKELQNYEKPPRME